MMIGAGISVFIIIIIIIIIIITTTGVLGVHDCTRLIIMIRIYGQKRVNPESTTRKPENI
jgi:hypothetical protein